MKLSYVTRTALAVPAILFSLAAQAGTETRKGSLISAFFGLDHALPAGANVRVCLGASKLDGMPVIFDRELDASTFNAASFQILTRSGKTGRVHCVTLSPALDDGELRTVLVVGDYGTAQDQPRQVRIVGRILSKDHSTSYLGAQAEVIPLEAGPTLVLAQVVPEKQWKTGVQKGSFGHGSGCPAGTRQVVRVTWAGGVLRPDGSDAGEREREQYRVTVKSSTGGTVEIHPFALGDLDDHDNNHLLCLDDMAQPLRVSFPAGLLADPNHDLNPRTAVDVTRE